MTCPAASGRRCSDSAQSASVALIRSQKGGPKQQLWEDERAGAHRTLGTEQHDGLGARNTIHETRGTREGESGAGEAARPPPPPVHTAGASSLQQIPCYWTLQPKSP